MHAFEKLGVFYLGREYDADRGVLPSPVLYDAKDLTTHAVCVGMTGSGKTGLCLSLLEEAAIDGIPALLIDPKGDLGNLLLAFPDLAPADFRPWIDESEAVRKGLTADEHAEATASLWKKGLAEWDQDGDRVRRFRDAVDIAIYTPGGSAGIPVQVLRSFDAPPTELLEDMQAYRDRVSGTVSSLLVLLGIDADPVQSREHIFLSNVLDHAWRAGRDLDLGTLVREVQDPPFERVGVLDLESFYPAKDRFQLAMGLNNLLASPGFSAWMEGEPLDIGRFLYTREGKPRFSILSIAHLGDAERMFFVSLFLNEVLAWTRAQPGTSSLRAILYMDEIFGFFPPTANPPSKTPMLTLLKQARAFGVGVVLSTQNPADLDYKGLSNAGTWFLGRLQTERDVRRVLDGLSGAAAATVGGFDRGALETTLAGLPGRVFLMNNVHEGAPTLFHTRWAMSYLRGPLTRTHIETLMAPRKIAARATSALVKVPAPTTATLVAVSASASRPILPPGIPEAFVPHLGGAGDLVYRPALLGRARIHYVSSAARVDEWLDCALVVPLGDEVPANPWESPGAVDASTVEVENEAAEHAAFADLPAEGANAKSYAAWSKALSTFLYQNRAVELWRCVPLKATSNFKEDEGAFRVRLRDAMREQRDAALEKLRTKYATKIAALEEKVRVAEQRVGREESQASQQKFQAAISVGSAVLGAFLGRKSAGVGRAATAMRGVGRISREKEDIRRAEETLEATRERLTALGTELRAETEELQRSFDADAITLETVSVRPRKSDTVVESVQLVWTPWRTRPGGETVADYEA